MISVLFAVLLMAASGSAELSDEENQALDNLVEESIVFEFEENTSTDLAKVLDATLIEVKAINLYDKNCSARGECWYSSHHILKSSDSLLELSSASGVLPFVAPGFKIKSKNDAQAFEKMLDIFFPVFFSSGKKIRQVGADWVFIREESFGDIKAIVATVDASGIIVGIEDVDEYGQEQELEREGE